MSETNGIDEGRLADWLADAVDPTISSVAVTRMAGGYSSGAWRVDVSGAAPRSLVLKAPELPSLVYRRDAPREGRIMEAAARHGAPVPAVVGIDTGTAAVGRPCFVMEFVEGRSVPDAAPGYHAEGWFREAGGPTQQAIWNSFHDALAALHGVDPAKVPDARHGASGVTDVLDYWQASLLDEAPAESVPRQLGVLAWLRANLPADADDAPALCMGDARLVNGLIAAGEVRALVDFEVAYVGNPAADIGYSLFFDERLRPDVDALPLPSADETWARWSARTGRGVTDRDYWMAFGATIVVVTTTRAMLQWGVAAESVERDHPFLAAWETVVDRAAR